MKTLEQLLAEHPFFSGLAPDHLKLFAGCAVTLRVDSGEFLFREGELARSFFVVRHGSIAITSVTPQEGLVTIQTLDEGDILGWSWLLPPYRWHFGARALEPAALISLDATCVRTKCEHDHEFGYEIMRRFAQVMASRLEATHLQLMNVYESRT
ncbi:MAG: cyclic nucleotide-binding domain-containing protein [Vicinamibacteraceae bacterium]|nr:cyclic nucleotide-binding domain-containing protein [Vicinamibacteraceae bacterium]